MNTEKVVKSLARMLNSKYNDYDARADEHIEWCTKFDIDLSRDCNHPMDHHYIGAQIAQRRREAENQARVIVSFVLKELKNDMSS